MLPINGLDRYSCIAVGGLRLLQPRCTDCYKTEENQGYYLRGETIMQTKATTPEW